MRTGEARRTSDRIGADQIPHPKATARAGRGLPCLLGAALLWATAACGAAEPSEGDGREGTKAKVGEPPPAQEAAQSRAGAPRPGENRQTAIRVAGVPVTVEIADDAETRRRGLMHRDSLPEDHGMLFVYSGEDRLSFWMLNTRMALDIAFLDRTGRIVDIQQMEPMSDETHTSREPAMYALEMRRGWFEDHGVTVGDRVEF